MKKIQRIIKKIWSYFLVHILKLEIKKTEVFNGIKLTINALEKGGLAYFSRSSYRESINPFYQLIQNSYKPNVILDIGANYGFTTNLYSKIFKDAQIYAIEPSNDLCKYIKLNLENNSADNVTLLQAICDDSEGETKNFSINPLYSQDNRVKGESILWKKEKVITTSIDSVLNNIKLIKFLFIKIDTQGFEKSVFKGGEKFLLNHSNWLIKTEFCPFCLEKQGTNPEFFLTYLIKNYDVVDFQGEISYKENSIDSLFLNKLLETDVVPFIEYVKKLDKKDIGWSDLLVRSKTQ